MSKLYPATNFREPSAEPAITTSLCSGALVVLGGLQIGQLAYAVHVVSRRGEPYRKVRAAVAYTDISGLVFLHDSPGFVAMHFNLNEADWRHASHVHFVDADAERRADWACPATVFRSG